MAEPFRVRVLGPLDVTVGDRPVGPAGSLRRALFALLALRAGEVVSVNTLVDGLWGELPPASATGVVQTYVSTWRKTLDAAGESGVERISTVGTGYRLRLEEDESDLLLFHRLAGDGHRLASAGRFADARSVLGRALALWRGPLLVDLAERPFTDQAAQAVAELRDQSLENWAEASLRTGAGDDLPRVLSVLSRLNADQPWRERSAELLMWALFAGARQRDALEVYETTRRRLSDELGVDPAPALRDMHGRVLRQDPALIVAAAAERPRRRPPRLDSFIGREPEVDQVCDLLGSARLVTLTGPGGSGKTRLAEEVAAELAARTGTETALVELAAIEDADLIPGTIASRLGIQASETVDALVGQLADRPLLLVLDNLEQIPAAGTVVDRVLRGTTDVRALATSREPLNVAGERRIAVDPLPLPDADERDPERLMTVPSVALLLDRARERNRVLPLTVGDAAAVRDVVRALDGLPLALETVAPWLAVLSPSGLLAELGRMLDLSARRSDAAARHRSLRAAIAWSHDRLTPDEQRLLARLSVLRGSGDLDAVRAIAGDDLTAPVVDVLMDLVDRNLVRSAEPVEGSPRFRLLETVRQFAVERLADAGETEATELRAAEWYASWAVELSRHSEGADAHSWLVRATADAENLRAAMDAFDRAGRTEDHLQLVVDALALWFGLGYEVEGERRLARALEASPRTAPARAMGLVALSWFVAVHQPERTTALIEEAISLAKEQGDSPVLALALVEKGDMAKDADEMRQVSTEAAALAEGFRDRPVRYAVASADAIVGEAADNLSAYAMYRDVEESIHWQRRALEVVERSGDQRQRARHLAVLSFLHLLADEAETARELSARACSLVSTSVNARWEDNVALARALVLFHRGELDAAESALRELIDGGLEAGRLLHVHYGSCCLVDLLLSRGQLVEADEVLTRAERLVSESENDLRHLTRLRARRARLFRLTGRPDEAAQLRKETEKGIDPAEMTPEHVIWLVEQVVAADSADEQRAWRERLDELSARTGVHVLPWERPWLDDSTR